jgi:hypothetical protein
MHIKTNVQLNFLLNVEIIIFSKVAMKIFVFL